MTAIFRRLRVAFKIIFVSVIEKAPAAWLVEYHEIMNQASEKYSREVLADDFPFIIIQRKGTAVRSERSR